MLREADEVQFRSRADTSLQFLPPPFSSPIARPMTLACPAAHRGFYFYILHVQMREQRIVFFSPPLTFLLRDISASYHEGEEER